MCFNLPAEQIAEAAYAGQGQYQDTVLNPVDQEPVGQNVVFSMSHPVAGKRVVFILFWEKFSRSKSATICSKYLCG